jgi:hypothetical protein
MVDFSDGAPRDGAPRQAQPAAGIATSSMTRSGREHLPIVK